MSPAAGHWHTGVRIDRGDFWADVSLFGGTVEVALITWPGVAPATLRTMGHMERLSSAPLLWRPRWSAAPIAEAPPGAYRRTLAIPLWIPFVLLAIPTWLLWRRDRLRLPPRCCQKCGYDLTGNVSGRCPECGATASAGVLRAPAKHQGAEQRQ